MKHGSTAYERATQHMYMCVYSTRTTRQLSRLLMVFDDLTACERREIIELGERIGAPVALVRRALALKMQNPTASQSILDAVDRIFDPALISACISHVQRFEKKRFVAARVAALRPIELLGSAVLLNPNAAVC